MADRSPRLGDVIDDYCPRCRLLLNHDVTSLFGDAVAKVTCRTCHNAHDYRHAQVPPSASRRRSRQEVADGPGARLACRAARAAAAAVRGAPAEARPVGRGRAHQGPKGSGLRAVDVIQKKRDGGELAPRGDRLLRPRLREGRGARLPGLGLHHGGLLPGDDAGRDGGAHRVDDADGRGARPPRAAGPQGRQALDGRRRRQDQPDPGAARRGLRRLRADDLGPRPRPHRRHARQARGDPGLRRQAQPRALPRGAARLRARPDRPDARDRARRPQALRAARRHRPRSRASRSSRPRS